METSNKKYEIHLMALLSILDSVRELSDDPNTKVGAIVFDDMDFSKYPAIGYNKPPDDWDILFNWSRDGEWLNTKYPYVIHAEMVAIINAFKKNLNLRACILCTSLFPCNECMKLIAQSGIKKVYYISDKYAKEPMTIASKITAKACGIEFHQVTQEEIENYQKNSLLNNLKTEYEKILLK